MLEGEHNFEEFWRQVRSIARRYETTTLPCDFRAELPVLALPA